MNEITFTRGPDSPMVNFKVFCAAIKTVAQLLAIMESASYAVLVASLPMNCLQAEGILLKMHDSGNIFIRHTREGRMVELTDKGRRLAAAVAQVSV